MYVKLDQGEGIQTTTADWSRRSVAKADGRRSTQIKKQRCPPLSPNWCPFACIRGLILSLFPNYPRPSAFICLRYATARPVCGWFFLVFSRRRACLGLDNVRWVAAMLCLTLALLSPRFLAAGVMEYRGIGASAFSALSKTRDRRFRGRGRRRERGRFGRLHRPARQGSRRLGERSV
jgi:hypothetical protein